MDIRGSDKIDKVVNLAKRRGFIFPGSEIYGGLANSWDYGPLGVELKNNIKQEWWKWFVQRREDIVGIDPAIIMNPKVWEASGHVGEFTDPLVECKKCHERFRADRFVTGVDSAINVPPKVKEDMLKERTLEELSTFEYARNHKEDWRDFLSLKKCPQCGGNELSNPRQFNLLFKTFIGPLEDSSALAYLRGELAQAMFVDFSCIAQTMRMRLPFGIAAQGRVFRNEITPGNFIFRTREFDLMEFEYFVREKEWKKWFEYWQKQMHEWLEHLGVDASRVHAHDIEKDELAHYSKRTIDIEYDYPFGRKELYGLAYRTDFDLKNHMEKSGGDLRYTDPESGEKLLPHVIEPTFGLDRSVLVAMLEAYHEEEAPTADGGSETRIVMRFPHWLAPVKVAVFPLVKNKKELAEKAREVFSLVLSRFAAQYDESGAVGRRYRRQDEIGTPFCVTVDFDSLKDESVTVRDRDSMKQTRVKVGELLGYISEKLS